MLVPYMYVSLRPSKKKHVSSPDFYKKESGRAFFFLLFIISYYMLSLHLITFPPGALRSNISKTKHQILIEHKFI